MKDSTCVTFKRLVALLGLTVAGGSLGGCSVSAYTTTSFTPHASNEPSSKRGIGGSRSQSSVVTTQSTTQPSRRGVTYALGLGKNQPVGSPLLSNTNADTATESETAEQVVQAVHYWKEHEAVRNIPSPYERLKVAERLKAAEEAAVANAKSRSVHIVLNRSEEDSLQILPSHEITVSSDSPTAVPTMFGRDLTDLDLNTPWVEMLIHEQQLKSA